MNGCLLCGVVLFPVLWLAVRYREGVRSLASGAGAFVTGIVDGAYGEDNDKQSDKSRTVCLDDVYYLFDVHAVVSKGFIWGVSDDSELVKEDKEYACGADETHTDEEYRIERGTECAPVGELIPHDILRDIPSDEEAGEESDDGKEELSGDEVKPVEEALAAYHEPVDTGKGEGAEYGNDAGGDGHYRGAALA